MSSSNAEKLSQLSLSEVWDPEIVDYICGPLAIYTLLNGIPSSECAIDEELEKISQFLIEHNFHLIDGSGITLETMVNALVKNFPELPNNYSINHLHRKDNEVDFIERIHKTIRADGPGKPIGLLQIGSYYAEIKNGANKWHRCDGHFLTLLEVDNRDPDCPGFFKAKVWDPWNGKSHWVVLYEELFRDFTAIDFNTDDKMMKTGFRPSPTGFDVLSPYLCVLAPHMDMFDEDIYFAQRMIFVLEAALV